MSSPLSNEREPKGHDRSGVFVILQSLSALALSEIGDYPCGYGFFILGKQIKRLTVARRAT